MDKTGEYLIKIIVILIGIIPTMVVIEGLDMTIFIVFVLIFLLNIRIRKLYPKEGLYILSLILDLVLIYSIFHRFGGQSHLFIAITLMDSILYFGKYRNGVILVASLFTAYLIKDRPYEIILLNAFIFSSFVFLNLRIKNMSNKIKEIEYLYDDVRRYSYELESAKNQVELYSKKVEELTQKEERNRISREIHDTIGHRLTGLLFQMEAGTRLLSVDNKKGEELLKHSVENLRESIEVLRKTVRSMKPKEHKNIIFSLKEMINRFKKDTGINIFFNVKGNPIKLYPGAELILFKNTQEGLTNALRHGKAKNIDVVLEFGKDKVSLIIKNDGILPKKFKRGMGLTGMEERLDFIGGRLNIYVEDKFIVENIIEVKS